MKIINAGGSTIEELRAEVENEKRRGDEFYDLYQSALEEQDALRE